MNWSKQIAGILLLMSAVGCSPYLADYRYVPRPGLVEVPSTQPDQPPLVSAFASVVGVRYADQQQNIPASVQVRLRLDNTSSQSIVFDPRTLDLVNGSLMRFPPPLLQPVQPTNIDPMQSAVFDAYFPFPQGYSYDNTDLQSLQLRWTLRLSNRNIGQTVNFRRAVNVYYDPYWEAPYWGYPYGGYGGVVIIRR